MVPTGAVGSRRAGRHRVEARAGRGRDAGEPRAGERAAGREGRPVAGARRAAAAGPARIAPGTASTVSSGPGDGATGRTGRRSAPGAGLRRRSRAVLAATSGDRALPGTSRANAAARALPAGREGAASGPKEARRGGDRGPSDEAVRRDADRVTRTPGRGHETGRPSRSHEAGMTGRRARTGRPSGDGGSTETRTSGVRGALGRRAQRALEKVVEAEVLRRGPPGAADASPGGTAATRGDRRRDRGRSDDPTGTRRRREGHARSVTSRSTRRDRKDWSTPTRSSSPAGTR